MTQLIKPVVSYEESERKIIAKLDIDYSNEISVDIDLLFNVLANTDRLILTINDQEMVSNMILDLSGALIYKNNDLILIHLANKGCVLIRKDGKLVATPYCENQFRGGEII